MRPFRDLEDVHNCYGKEKIIAITELKQIFFYAKHGVQPKWIDESETKPGKIVAYYFTPETEFMYRKWRNNRPTKNCI